MRINKLFVLILLSFAISLSLLGCSSHDPEQKQINAEYSLATLYGDVALIHHLSDGGDEIIVCKDFIAYATLKDKLFLCEKTSTNTHLFWVYNLSDGSNHCYESYDALAGGVEQAADLMWDALWVEPFNIQTETGDILVG